MIIKPIQKYDPIDQIKRKNPTGNKERSEGSFQTLIDDIDIVEFTSDDHGSEQDNKPKKEQTQNSDSQNSQEKKLDKFV